VCTKICGLLCAAGIAIVVGLIVAMPCEAQQLTNEKLSLNVNAKDGSYQLGVRGGQPIFTSRVAAQVDHQWLRSSEYPRHQVAESAFSDELGPGHAVTVTFSGLDGKPDLIYIGQVYDQRPYAAVQVQVRNTTNRGLTLQAIRSVEAVGEPMVNLGGQVSADRILSDSFSEDWPELHLYDLGKAPAGMHRGAGSQLIYNRDSKQSLFLGALSSDRFLTLLHLQAAGTGAETKIVSFSADSTGTTEVQKEFDMKNAPAEDLIELSLPLAPGGEMRSERLLVEAGPDYHGQLLAYGEAIRRLHHARVSVDTPIGWWSWTAFYGGINEGETLANADWQAEHLTALGYKYFQIDEGYQYARGEYATANATQFPDGLRFVGNRITADGLTFGIWTGPFEVTSRAWVYEHHRDWLVHNAKGEPIRNQEVWHQKTDVLYTLDTTNPGAQEYLRQTYKTLVREWGVRFIKLDFMDTTAIEGYRYRPNTTALEAQRIGLQIIRDTVGEDVVLDKDGSPMLNAVGLVDTGRISTDTAHAFQATKEAGPGIAARFYMHRNFFVNDPDAFNTTAQAFPDIRRELSASLELSAAQASIALAAVSGGMYEIGDDMTVLGSQKDRLALVENADLLAMAKIGRASVPIDLMTYADEDEQPSIFFLQESPRQSILTLFNWTKSSQSHTLKLADLGLRGEHTYAASDVLKQNAPTIISDGTVRIAAQAPESVNMIKLIDSSVSPAAPIVKAEVPGAAKAGEIIHLSAQSETGSPAVAYHWDFGDGTSANGSKVSHAYTHAAQFTVRLTVDGVDGVPAVQNFPVNVTGSLTAFPNLSHNRRYQEPADH
jgi:alpha-galactosidase